MTLSRGDREEIARMIGAAQRAVSYTKLETPDMGQVAEDAADSAGQGIQMLRDIRYIFTTTASDRSWVDVHGELNGELLDRRFYFPPNDEVFLKEFNRIQASNLTLVHVAIAPSDEEYSYFKGAEISAIHVRWQP